MIEQIQPAQLTHWITSMQAHGDPLVLDVREAWELQTASVRSENFELLHIPMQAIPPRLSELDPNRPIACLCHHGGRSMQVAAFLVNQGFSHVANVAGGIHAWSTQVDPSVPQY
jgi:rhodanese-related sulfurtransferase